MKRPQLLFIVLGVFFVFMALGGCAASGGSSASSETGASASAASSASASAATSASASASASSSAAEPETTKALQRSDAKTIDAVLGYFDQLAAIPRQTKNEQAVSDFLKGWAEERGFTVTQDAANNIIFDVPATKGMDALPRVGLQAHMDMVCVAAAGVAYNPATDPINVVRDDAADTLTANGTSLGADDGIGIALIMDVCESGTPHGPLRVFFTTDEEEDFTGVSTIDPALVQDLGYLINVDGEEADAIIVSSAGGQTLTSVASLNLKGPECDSAVTFTLEGLLGGHSGFQINDGHCNAVIELANMLNYFSEEGLPYELASLNGGTAENAIPSEATATIAYNASDAELLNSLYTAYQQALLNDYAGIEPNLSLRMDKVAVPNWVIEVGSASSVLSYALNCFNGVYTMSDHIEGLVESSSNLGVFRANESDGFYARSFARSSNRDRLDEIIQQQLDTAAQCGFEAQTSDYNEAWPYNPESTLRPLCEKVYKENEGQDVRILAIHAALECGSFTEKNAQLDIVSIGPTLYDVHSAEETLRLSSIPVTWRLLAGVLAAIE